MVAHLSGARADGKRKSGRPAPTGWTVQAPDAYQADSFKEAAEELLPEPAPYQAWKNDTDSPGNKEWRRYISVSEDGTEWVRSRIVKTRSGYVYEEGK